MVPEQDLEKGERQASARKPTLRSPGLFLWKAKKLWPPGSFSGMGAP